MPGYAGSGQAKLIRDNTQVYLFQQENVAAGSASISVQIERVNRTFYPWGMSFQISFTDVSGNPLSPGTFEIDFQTSDIDADSQYCTIQTFNNLSQLNANFVGRYELPNFYAKFIRAKVTTIGAGAYTTILATR